MLIDRRSAVAGLLAVGSGLARAQASIDPLVIRSSGGKSHLFQVEVARTDQQRATGLMFRRHMPPDRGMLFDFERDGEVTMWMRNTYITLDMLFIRANGAIHSIAARTEPFSERTIASGGPVRAVLEINGGICEKLGIVAGDRVQHPMFRG